MCFLGNCLNRRIFVSICVCDLFFYGKSRLFFVCFRVWGTLSVLWVVVKYRFGVGSILEGRGGFNGCFQVYKGFSLGRRLIWGFLLYFQRCREWLEEMNLRVRGWNENKEKFFQKRRSLNFGSVVFGLCDMFVFFRLSQII